MRAESNFRFRCYWTPYCGSLQRPIGQPQLWSQQWDPLLELVEVGPGKVSTRPATAA